ncbi:Starch-binding associating with outer membrane [Sphingobacterium nematocida]|uniref:Starch-binding associating with outer membrane n=1 Tax=Sphingobacterium nematocida TaxID=1513896 RepID=A0A1T5DEE7_9SPHI|nr:RagB/SusD family nutrient uptake outer membrane protein [Sphingobacterium nematocida]SKB69967.1 Starch-binding associating with outer membrane [Sphingobacterium nematocida]
MKKIFFYTLIGSLLFSSCNEFLDREPLGEISTETYLKTDNDLASYAAGLYTQLPSHTAGAYGLGTFATDNGTDNQAATAPNTVFVKGQTRVPNTGGDWDFSTIRSTNYFINTVTPRIEKGEISGNETLIKHCLGEVYFFRAFTYFNKLVSLGDFPIVTEAVTDNYEAVVEQSKRRPRNEVARFILADLDKAFSLMQATAPAQNRLSKNVAALLKSRVALFEATWEKYHKGTARVPGGPGWPGANKDYLKDFSINIDQEIRFFLEQAKESAKIVAEQYTLAANYQSMFNSNSLTGNSEVLLWRAYSTNSEINIFHYVVGNIQRNGGGNTGFTKDIVESHLMQNGLPIYANGSGYQGDKTYANTFASRDPRMGYNILKTGDLLADDPSFNEWALNGKGYFYRPPIVIGLAELRSTTGYSLKKGLTPDANQAPTKTSTIASVVFRAAEAYLNYIEADFELNGVLDQNSIKYWKAIRTRSNMDTDIDKTIQYTDLSKENDWAKYSAGVIISPTLYNIRRERRIEFAAEGMRWNDLKRWRALDQVSEYHVQGFNLWDENYKLYSNPEHNISPIQLIENGNANSNVSARTDSKYLRIYRANAGNIAFNGYTWNQNKYLNPIATTHFRLTTAEAGNEDYSTSSIYQNPGWSTVTNSVAVGD